MQSIQFFMEKVVCIESVRQPHESGVTPKVTKHRLQGSRYMYLKKQQDERHTKQDIHNTGSNKAADKQ